MIQMKNGVYGGKDGMKRAADGPFSLSAKEEARLVERGVAEYVNSAPAPDPELPDLPEGVTAIPEYSVGDTAAFLRKVGGMCGLTFKVGMSKADMVAALDKHIKENTVEDEELVTVDSEPAPSFDPAEAVK